MNSQYVSENVAKSVLKIQDVYNISDLQLFAEFRKVSYKARGVEPSRVILSKIQSGGCRVSKTNRAFFIEALSNLTLRKWSWGVLDSDNLRVEVQQPSKAANKPATSKNTENEYKHSRENENAQKQANMEATSAIPIVPPKGNGVTIGDTFVFASKQRLLKKPKKWFRRIVSCINFFKNC
jgi:hypothetical protein